MIEVRSFSQFPAISQDFAIVFSIFSNFSLFVVCFSQFYPGRLFSQCGTVSQRQHKLDDNVHLLWTMLEFQCVFGGPAPVTVMPVDEVVRCKERPLATCAEVLLPEGSGGLPAPLHFFRHCPHLPTIYCSWIERPMTVPPALFHYSIPLLCYSVTPLLYAFALYRCRLLLLYTVTVHLLYFVPLFRFTFPLFYTPPDPPSRQRALAGRNSFFLKHRPSEAPKSVSTCPSPCGSHAAGAHSPPPSESCGDQCQFRSGGGDAAMPQSTWCGGDHCGRHPGGVYLQLRHIRRAVWAPLCPLCP